MKRALRLIIVTACLVVTNLLSAQNNVGIGTATPKPSAKLDVESTTQGFLPPRMTGAQRDAITTPVAAGLMVWCIDCGTDGEMQLYNGTNWIILTTQPCAAPAAPSIIVGNETLSSLNASNEIYTVSPVANTSSYYWTIPAGAIINSGQGTNSIDVSYVGFAGGNISVQAKNGCGSSTLIDITISCPVPLTPGFIIGKAVLNSANANNIVYAISPVANAISYTWTLPAGTIINSGQGTASINVTFSGLTTGNVSVQSVSGCGNSSFRDKAVIANAQIGDLFAGGIIFYLDGNGGGKVSALTDQGTNLPWTTTAFSAGPVPVSVTYPNGAGSLTDGWSNSNAIVAQAGFGTTYAAGVCRAHSEIGDGGLNDWYLPAKDELFLMYVNLKRFGCLTNAPLGYDSDPCATTLGNFTGNYYWSSTEDPNFPQDYAWNQYFSWGSQSAIQKHSVYLATRAIRAF